MNDIKLSILFLFLFSFISILLGHLIFDSFFREDLKEFSLKIIQEQKQIGNIKKNY